MSEGLIELEPLFKLNTAYKKSRYFCEVIIKELEICHSFLSPQEATGLFTFSTYYGDLGNKGKELRNHWSHRHAQRVQHLVGVVSDDVKILDAGCGFGSESILCGILGAEVTGVDLIEPWLNTAKKRLKFYEGVLGKSISTEFHAQSVFDTQGSFDVIWSLESISHIDPPERFISFAHDHLNKGGRLIISDPNKLNPLIYWNARRDAKKAGSLHSQVENPKTGEMVPFAWERVFSVASIKKLLLSNGFVIESFNHSGLLPYLPYLNVKGKNISIHLETLMNPFWPKWLAGIYTVVTRKV